MSASISILGNTGTNAELRYSDQGLPIASFSMASNSFRNTPDGKVQVTEWFNITAFGKVAETLGAHLKKGAQLLVLGRLTFKPWVTNNGEPRAGAEVILHSFEFAGGNRNNVPDVESESAIDETEYTGGVEEPSTSTNGAATHIASDIVKEPFENQF